MRTGLVLFFLLIVCTATQFGKVAFGASNKIPLNEIKAVACVLEDKRTGKQDEFDRVAFTGVGGLWTIDDNCEKAASEHAKQHELSEWRHLCCPITADDKVHCESPFGYHGKY